MKKIILNKAKVSKNEYFFIDNDSEIKKSSKIIFFIKFWIENKKTLKKKKHIVKKREFCGYQKLKKKTRKL